MAAARVERTISSDGGYDNEGPVPEILPEFLMPKLTENEHPLEYPYVYSYFKRPPGNFNPENYVKHVRPVGTFSTVEQFWRLYTHLQRPGEAVDKVDFHVFKRGIKPVWEDDANKVGGKFMIRLRKGMTSRIWENLIMAMIGEQFMVGDEICGAVCSVRNQEDIVSLWNRSADDQGVMNRIRDTMRRVLNLPSNTVLEYKRHDDSLRDQTSYRNTDIFKR